MGGWFDPSILFSSGPSAAGFHLVPSICSRIKEVEEEEEDMRKGREDTDRQ